MNLITKDGTRRLSPKEREFTTVVLKALASTSEDDIDERPQSRCFDVWLRAQDEPLLSHNGKSLR